MKVDNKGVTLIELLVSVLIFSVVSVLLAYTIVTAIRHNFINSLRDKAVSVLNSKVNELKSLDYDDNLLSEGSGCGNPDDPNDPFIYIYRYGNENSDNITYVICYNIYEVSSDNATYPFKRIELTVRWRKPYNANEEEDEIKTIFFKAKETR